jgi:hypothetical protein
MGVKSSLAWARTTWPAESRARRVVQVEASLQCIRRCMKSCALMQVVVDASSVAAAIGCYDEKIETSFTLGGNSC